MKKENLCKQIRKRHRLTQAGLAIRLNKCASTIQKWEQADSLKPRIVAILMQFDSENAV